tara:strand:- start:8639 stop:8989 length:351 start_codon:yes stop_codon:yes gene_type:complete
MSKKKTSLSSKSTRTNTETEYISAREVLKNKKYSVGQTFKALRICDEMTQTELAKKLKISRQHLCDIENDRKALSIERVVSLAKAVGYPAELFVYYHFRAQLQKVGIKKDIKLVDL